MATKAPPKSSLGTRIFDARLRAGITQQDLALSIGLSGVGAGCYISRIEANRQEPRIGTLRRIAKHLNVPLSELIG